MASGATIRQRGEARGRGLFGRPNRYIQRNKLACIISAFLASLFVALLGFTGLWVTTGLRALTGQSAGMDNPVLVDTPFGEGVAIAIIACMFNFYFIPIIVPVTWMILSQSVGRLAHRGFADKWVYLRWSGFWGAFLVGGTCATPVFFGFQNDVFGEDSIVNQSDSIAFLLGSVITGGIIGALAGILVGLMFIAIVRPAAQVGDSKAETIAVF